MKTEELIGIAFAVFILTASFAVVTICIMAIITFL
mgnify:CR=1 FL=1